MSTPRTLAFGWVIAAAWLGAAAANPAHAQYPRRSPVVEAVAKTRDGIVTLKVDKADGYDGTRETTGTGVVVDERGYIVTSRHVIDGGTRVRVHLVNGTELAARVLTAEARTDLAILRVRPPKPLGALTLGPGSDLLVGETVIAVGHPYGYSHTVSTGVISAVGRQITMPSGEVLTNLIQIDASINPGNSGGPLLNINGELIGINAAIRDGAHGIAFAINVDTVKGMLHRHLSLAAVAGTCHGLTCTERVLAEGPRRQRVVVAEVADRTPAAAAGLRRGDEILRVAGRAVANPFDLERALWDWRPGEPITLAVLRQGKEVAVPLTRPGAAGASPVVVSRPPG